MSHTLRYFIFSLLLFNPCLCKAETPRFCRRDWSFLQSLLPSRKHFHCSLWREKKYLHFLPADPFFHHSHLSIRSVAVSTFELASQSFLTTAPPLSKLKKRTSGKQNHSFYSWLSVFRPQRMLISWTLYIHPFNVSIFKSNCWRGGCLSPKTQVVT